MTSYSADNNAFILNLPINILKIENICSDNIAIGGRVVEPLSQFALTSFSNDILLNKNIDTSNVKNTNDTKVTKRNIPKSDKLDFHDKNNDTANCINWCNAIYRKLYDSVVYDDEIIKGLISMFVGQFNYSFEYFIPYGIKTNDSEYIYIKFSGVMGKTHEGIYINSDKHVKNLNISLQKINELVNDEKEFLQMKQVEHYRMINDSYSKMSNCGIVQTQEIYDRLKSDKAQLIEWYITYYEQDMDPEYEQSLYKKQPAIPFSFFSNDEEKKEFIDAYNMTPGPNFPVHLLQNEQENCNIS